MDKPPFLQFFDNTNWHSEGHPLLAEGHLAKDAWNAALDAAIHALFTGDTTLTTSQRLEALKYHEPSHAAIYDPTFGDDKLCECGHEYYRHFDTHDDMANVGCKYCVCYTFKQSTTK